MDAPIDTTGKAETIDLFLVQKWLRESGDFALAQRNPMNAKVKADGSLVSAVDLHIESLLVSHISATYPDHQILSEEGKNRNNPGKLLWTIDPIDGTRVYMSGLPAWGISVGIFKEGKPYAGAFFMPATREMYWGVDDRGFFNDQPVALRDVIDLENPLAFIAVPSNAHNHYRISFNRLRSLGSTTAHLAYVACGFATAALTRRIYVWDIAPVLPLLKAAGIGLAYLSGETFDSSELLDGHLSPEPLVAAPLGVIDEIRKLIQMKQER